MRRGRSAWLAYAALLTAILTIFAESPGRAASRPANLAEVVTLAAVKDLVLAGERASPRRVAEVSQRKLDAWNDAHRDAMRSGYLPMKDYVAHRERILAASQTIQERTRAAERANRPSFFDVIYRILTIPGRIVGEVTKQVAKILPPELRPALQVFVAYHAGRKFDSLSAHLRDQLRSSDRAMDIYDAWRKILPYKDDPGRAGRELRDRLKELSRGELGRIFDELGRKGVTKLPRDTNLQQIFVAQLEELKRRAQRDVDRSIDDTYEKKKARVEKLVRTALREVPGSNFRRRIDEASAELKRDTMVGRSGYPASGFAVKLGGPAGPLVVGEESAFTATMTKGKPPYVAEFDFGDGQKEIVTSGGKEASSSHAYARSGGFTAIVTVVDAANEARDASLEVTVEEKEKLEVAVTHAPDELQVNEAGTFEASITGAKNPVAVVVDWSEGEATRLETSATSVSASHTYAAAGTFTVTFSATDAARREASAGASVVVFEKHPFAGTLSGSWQGTCGDVTVTGTFSMAIAPDGRVTGHYQGDDEGEIGGRASIQGSLTASGSGGAGVCGWSGAFEATPNPADPAAPPAISGAGGFTCGSEPADCRGEWRSGG